MQVDQEMLFEIILVSYPQKFFFRSMLMYPPGF
jgi:hypothetical protein